MPAPHPTPAYDELLARKQQALVDIYGAADQSWHSLRLLDPRRQVALMALDEMIPFALERYHAGELEPAAVMAAVSEVAWSEYKAGKTGMINPWSQRSPAASFNDGLRVYGAMPSSTLKLLMDQMAADWLMRQATGGEMPPYAAYPDMRWIAGFSVEDTPPLRTLISLTGHAEMAVETMKALQRLHFTIDAQGPPEAARWLRDAPLGDLNHLLGETAACCSDDSSSGIPASDTPAMGVIGRLEQLYQPLLERFVQMHADRGLNSNIGPMLALPVSPSCWLSMARDIRACGGEVLYCQYDGPSIGTDLTGAMDLRASLRFSIQRPGQWPLVVELTPVDATSGTKAVNGITAQTAIRRLRSDASDEASNHHGHAQGALRYRSFRGEPPELAQFHLLHQDMPHGTSNMSRQLVIAEPGAVDADKLFAVQRDKRHACRAAGHEGHQSSTSVSPGPAKLPMARTRSCRRCGELLTSWTWAHDLPDGDPFRIDEQSSGRAIMQYVTRLAAQAVSIGELSFTRARQLTLADVRTHGQRATDMARASDARGNHAPPRSMHRKMRA